LGSDKEPDQLRSEAASDEESVIRDLLEMEQQRDLLTARQMYENAHHEAGHAVAALCLGIGRFGESDIAFGFAPEAYIEEFEDFMHRPKRRSVRFVDPTWSTERMIAHLARYRGILSPFDPEPEL